MAANNNKIYRKAWADAGHEPDGWHIAAHYHCVLCEDKEEAREIGREAWRRYQIATTHTRDRERMDREPTAGSAEAALVQDPPDINAMVADLRTVACTPEETVELLTAAQDSMGFTQCDTTFFFGGISYEQARRSMELFTSKVMPKLRGRKPAISS